MPPCIRHAQCVSHAHNEQGVAVGEKILAYRNLWSPRDRPRSRYSLVAEPRQISLSDDLSRPQFPYFEDQFWSFLRILRIILRKTSFLVNPPVHENVVDMLYFSANIWSKKRIQFFPLLFFTTSINRVGCTKERIRERIFRTEEEWNFCDTRKKNHFVDFGRPCLLGTKRSSIISERIGDDLRVRKSFPGGIFAMDRQRTVWNSVSQRFPDDHDSTRPVASDHPL